MTVCTLVTLLTLLPLRTACADGGIVVPDAVVWANIEEGQQIAVIQLREDDSAQVDLFITMADHSGESHQVTFFIPLGQEVRDFGVVEESSRDFDEALTEELDERIRDYAQRKSDYASNLQLSLLLGAVTTNGLWTWLIAAPFLLSSSCGSRLAAPVATFETESSLISIYDMDEDMDLEALMETTGLDPSVKETLESYRGQQIAIVDLKTHVEGETDEWLTESEQRGQPGIHMTWLTGLVRMSEEATYTYPLGTGRAWASPIELTRVYVVAPKGVDVELAYPELGTDLSGLEGGWGWGGLAQRIRWRIDDATSPAYAIDRAYGSYGQVWRATYVKSNADRDVTVTRLAVVSDETRSAIRSDQLRGRISRITWIVSLAAGGLSWVLAWWLAMTRLCKAPYRWRDRKLWIDAFLWSVIYPFAAWASLFVVGIGTAGLAFALSFLGAFGILGLIAAIPIVFIALSGSINAYFYARSHAAKLNVSRARAFGAYMLAVALANGIFAVFALTYYGLFAGV